MVRVDYPGLTVDVTVLLKQLSQEDLASAIEEALSTHPDATLVANRVTLLLERWSAARPSPTSQHGATRPSLEGICVSDTWATRRVGGAVSNVQLDKQIADAVVSQNYQDVRKMLGWTRDNAAGDGSMSDMAPFPSNGASIPESGLQSAAREGVTEEQLRRELLAVGLDTKTDSFGWTQGSEDHEGSQVSSSFLVSRENESTTSVPLSSRMARGMSAEQIRQEYAALRIDRERPEQQASPSRNCSKRKTGSLDRPIVDAVASQDYDEVRRLLGWSENSEEQTRSVSKQNGRTPVQEEVLDPATASERLLQAVVSDQGFDKVQLLLALRADVNHCTSSGVSSAGLVATAGRPIGILQLLLDARADPHHLTFAGQSLCHLWATWPAVSSADREEAQAKLELLLKSGADINARMELSGETPLHIAAEAFQQFSKQGSNRERTAQGYADGARFQFQMLLKLGANANLKNAVGKTPLDVVDKEFQEALCLPME